MDNNLKKNIQEALRLNYLPFFYESPIEQIVNP